MQCDVGRVLRESRYLWRAIITNYLDCAMQDRERR
jgi:hypothetical protein